METGKLLAVTAVSALAVALLITAQAHSDILKFEAGSWSTECDVVQQTSDDGCAIYGLFGTTLPNGTKGSFSLLVDLADERVVVVGEPSPSRATIQIDKNQPLDCTATPHCIFSAEESDAITRELKGGSLILIDVVTPKAVFRTSMSTLGYRAVIAKILANTPAQSGRH